MDAFKLISSTDKKPLAEFSTHEILDAIYDKPNSNISYEQLLDHLIQFNVNNASAGDSQDISNSKLLTTYLSKSNFVNRTGFNIHKNQTISKIICRYVVCSFIVIVHTFFNFRKSNVKRLFKTFYFVSIIFLDLFVAIKYCFF